MSESLYIQLDIVTLEKPLFNGKVKQISVPTSMGEVTILPNHIPLIIPITAGELRLKVNEGEGIFSPDYIFIAVAGGFMEVKPDSVVNIMADSAMRVDEIDEKKALEAKEKAENMLKDYQTGKLKISDQEFVGASAQLTKALAQLKVIRRKKK